MLPVRPEPSVLHVDLDAFFASVEQLDKPSLRGRPVVVGGVGPRGVVATASYEARAYGVHSALPTAQARARCPHAAYLAPRFSAYAAASATVMALLRERSPLVEPLSLDEAYVDLVAETDLSVDGVREVAAQVKAAVLAATGVTASVGAGTSKLVAKIASDLDKPDGLVVVAPGTETAVLHPMPVTRLPGVGPATTERLRRTGVHTVRDLARVDPAELVGLLGSAHGGSLARLARAEDDRPVVPDRETKSVSAEDTFARDLTEPALLAAELDRLAARVVARLRRDGQSGRTVTVKVRLHDFTTLSRSLTLAGPTDAARTIHRVARGLLAEIDVSGGVRLLGVGVSGLTDWSQADLFDSEDVPARLRNDPEVPERDEVVSTSFDGAHAGTADGPRQWVPGQDVEHAAYGPGWVWGAGLGRVTVRFESRETGPGPVRTLAADDPDLHAQPPPPR